MLDEALVGRMDLKADRKTGRLLVLGAFHEDGTAVDVIAQAAAQEVTRLSVWLGLDEVEVGSKGGLSKALAAAGSW